MLSCLICKWKVQVRSLSTLGWLQNKMTWKYGFISKKKKKAQIQSNQTLFFFFPDTRFLTYWDPSTLVEVQGYPIGTKFSLKLRIVRTMCTYGSAHLCTIARVVKLWSQPWLAPCWSHSFEKRGVCWLGCQSYNRRMQFRSHNKMCLVKWLW